jgi:hypothetical protein
MIGPAAKREGVAHLQAVLGDRQLEATMRARATPVRVFLLSERGRGLGDVAPNREGALACRATMLCGRLLWIRNVKEIRDLIVNR